MNADPKSPDTHVSIDELASLLGISEAAVLAHEETGAIPPSEVYSFSGGERRMYPRQKALEMWAEWKSYCEFVDEEDGTNHANH